MDAPLLSLVGHRQRRPGSRSMEDPDGASRRPASSLGWTRRTKRRYGPGTVPSRQGLTTAPCPLPCVRALPNPDAAPALVVVRATRAAALV